MTVIVEESVCFGVEIMSDDKKVEGLRIEHRTCEFCHGLGCNMCYFGIYSVLVTEDNILSIF